MSAHPTSTLLAGRPGLLVLREGSGDPVSDRLGGASPERVIDLPVSDRATAAVGPIRAEARRRT
ncbi:MAG TPA: hypothetical protein PKA64_25950, partial [Myxococcota bacterium]|nr:hypothetical protein [Myxococcota bacterium]